MLSTLDSLRKVSHPQFVFLIYKTCDKNHFCTHIWWSPCAFLERAFIFHPRNTAYLHFSAHDLPNTMAKVSVSPLSLPAQPLLCSNCCTNQHKIKCSHPQQGESAEQGPLETADTVLQLLYYRIRHFRSNSQHGTSSSMKRFIHPSPDCSRVNIFNFSVHQKAQLLHNSSPQANDLRYLSPEVFLG